MDTSYCQLSMEMLKLKKVTYMNELVSAVSMIFKTNRSLQPIKHDGLTTAPVRFYM